MDNLERKRRDRADYERRDFSSCHKQPQVSAAGIVTLTSSCRTNFQSARLSSGGSRRLPCAHRFTSKLAKGLSGDEVTLRVEDVVDSSVGGQELLR